MPIIPKENPQRISKIFKKQFDLLIIYFPFLLSGAIILTRKNSSDLPFCFFLVGFTGIIMIIRKEQPGPFGYYRGRWVIILGVALTIMFWGSALYLLIFGLK